MGKIYHYTTLKTAIEFILPSMKLRTNFLSKMNGPNENQTWSFGGVNVPYEELYPLPYSESQPDRAHFERMYLFGEEIKSKVQAICFVNSDKHLGYQNEMMWAQYAENHKGVCLEIDSELFIHENEDADIFKFQDIDYSTKEEDWFYWNRNLSKEENIDHFIKRNFETLFLTKSHYWRKEYEKRLLILAQQPHYLSIKESLTGIYYGLFLKPECYHVAVRQFLDPQVTNTYRVYYESNKMKRMEIKTR
jgi:hypothetical protein